MLPPLTGSCFCGTVKYRLESEPMFVNCCHCTDCQKQTGSAFAINAVIEADRVTLLSGKPEAVAMRTDSGTPHDIYRCPECQSALWSDYGYRVILMVRVATLDEPSLLPPQAHIFTRSKLAWVRLPENVPAFEVYYDMEIVYPPASLARRRAVLGDR